ncbi:MAG: hypothetical protein ABI488_16160 [Polyangiaceae bacterium]
MQYDRLVIGYHGCSAEVAEAILDGGEFVPSENEHDWLGRGIYFWEYGLDRAWQWARVNAPDAPSVVGAIIQLGNCFDLLDTRFTGVLAKMAGPYVKTLENFGRQVPRNRGRDGDMKGRYFDCALVNWCLDFLADQPAESRAVYQCVRGSFQEGGAVYEDPSGLRSAIFKESHIQIAVRDSRCIIGTFRPTG